MFNKFHKKSHFIQISLIIVSIMALATTVRGYTEPTTEDLKKVESSLSQEQKINLEKMSSVEKSRLLKVLFCSKEQDRINKINGKRLAKEAKERMEARKVAREKVRLEAAENKTKATKEFLDNTSELRKVWNYFNSVDRVREKSLEMWKTYLKDNPDTPFRPEIYYRMATLFTHRRNPDLGEKQNLEKAEQYYQMSINGFGEKFSDFSSSARLSLCNFPSHKDDIEYRKRCYEWLKYIDEHGTADDMWPVNQIGRYFTSRQVEISPEEMASWSKILKKKRPNVDLLQMSHNAMQFASESDLLNLSKSYPGTKIAKMANDKLWGTDKSFAPSLFEPIEAPLFESNQVNEQINKDVIPQVEEAAIQGINTTQGQPAVVTNDVESDSPSQKSKFAIITVLVVTVCGFLYLVFRLKRRKV